MQLMSAQGSQPRACAHGGGSDGCGGGSGGYACFFVFFCLFIFWGSPIHFHLIVCESSVLLMQNMVKGGQRSEQQERGGLLLQTTGCKKKKKKSRVLSSFWDREILCFSVTSMHSALSVSFSAAGGVESLNSGLSPCLPEGSFVFI